MLDRPERRHQGKAIDTSIISSMPDEILHHILSFIPTDLAVRTSVLSRRWRHVWCETPCLYFDDFETAAQGINRFLVSYRAPKIMSFRFSMIYFHVLAPLIDSWIEFAMSRNVKKLCVSIVIHNDFDETYRCPDILYCSSSLEKLYLRSADITPRCTVSWRSLRKLTLDGCNLYDESIANILSGCPILENLGLSGFGGLLKRLDLSKSLSLRILRITRHSWFRMSGPLEIIAPHIHYLSLISDAEHCTLADVSSLTEASLDMYMYITTHFLLEASFVESMVLKILEKLKNVERLTIGRTLLLILSLAELSGIPFPTLKVQTLIVYTILDPTAIPGIVRLLQNSPDLKKLIAHATKSDQIEDLYFGSYLNLHGLNPDQCWRSEYFQNFPPWDFDLMVHCKNATSKLFASFMELVLRNSKTLETMVIYFKPLTLEWFAKLLQMPPTLSHNNNVSIVLNPSNYSLIASVSLS